MEQYVRIEDHTAIQQERDILNSRLLSVQVSKALLTAHCSAHYCVCTSVVGLYACAVPIAQHFPNTWQCSSVDKPLSVGQAFLR